MNARRMEQMKKTHLGDKLFCTQHTQTQMAFTTKYSSEA